MNKKVIAIIVAIIVVIAIGVVGFLVVNNRNSASSNTNNSNNSSNQQESTGSNDTEDITTGSNTLVLYFSQSGNTEAVANIIHDEVGGDMIKLETEVAYPSDYDELVDYAQDEQRDDARPALKTVIENISGYDTIFLGYPNWWGDMPMPIYTFLDEYDLSGKTIAPFITHGGSGLSGTPAKIASEESGATVTEGLAISGSSARSSGDTVRSWLSRIGY